MLQEIVKYLSQNKEKFSREILMAELRKAGYSDFDINEGATLVFEQGDRNSFWNFKEKKIYLSSSEKWKDFLFGFFVPNAVYVSTVLIPFYGGVGGIITLPLLLVEIYLIVYFFKIRKILSFGMIAGFVVVRVLLPAFFLSFYFLGSYL
jgi:hypothetical protein